MNILQVNTFDIQGGAGRAAYRLHKALTQIGETCRTLVRYKQSTDDAVTGIIIGNAEESFAEALFLGAIQETYIDAHRTDISNTLFSFPYPGCDLSNLDIVREADIINLHWVARYQSPVTLQKLFALGKPIVWTLHDQWAFTGGCHYSGGCGKYTLDCSNCPQLADNPFDLPAAILRDKLELFPTANLTVVTPSRWLAGCARESALFRELRVESIPNSLETDFFVPIPKPEAKQKLGIAADTTALLFGSESGDEKRKGFRELVLAIRCCKADTGFQTLMDEGRLKVICFGKPGKEIESLGVPWLSLGYLNSDEQIRKAYSAADIFVLPSLEDNLPNTMLESMSCGTPVVCFNVGGMSDVIEDGLDGILVCPYDHEKMAHGILALVSDSSRRTEMGVRAREKMVERYSLGNQARNYISLYADLIKSNAISWDTSHE